MCKRGLLYKYLHNIKCYIIIQIHFKIVVRFFWVQVFSMFFNPGMTINRGDKLQKDKISFKDVAGLKEAKVEIMEYVDYIKSPENFTVRLFFHMFAKVVFCLIHVLCLSMF